MIKKIFFALSCSLLFASQSFFVFAQEKEMAEVEIEMDEGDEMEESDELKLDTAQGLEIEDMESVGNVENDGDEKKNYPANMEGFLNWIVDHPTLSWRFKSDAKAALEFLNDGLLAEYTNFNAPTDATSFQNLKASLFLLETCNALRQESGVSSLKVSLQLMVIAQKQLNFSDTQMDHAKAYSVAENLAWGYIDPFEGWYFDEKPLYEQEGPSKKVGHYLNITSPSFHSMGAAHNTNSQYGWSGQADGQVYSSHSGVMEVAELESLVTQFEAELGLNDSILTPILPSPTLPEGQVALYRLYNSLSGEHFYTLSQEERNSLLKDQVWKDEGIGWITPSISAIPVYRLVNPNTGDHHYTLDLNEYTTLPTYGWKAEGLTFYSAENTQEKAVPLYRLYNPNATEVGMHHYTPSQNERDTLVQLGWKDEGIAWYGFLAS